MPARKITDETDAHAVLEKAQRSGLPRTEWARGNRSLYPLSRRPPPRVAVLSPLRGVVSGPDGESPAHLPVPGQQVFRREARLSVGAHSH